MANGFYEIDEQTFKNMPSKDREWILYKTFNSYRTVTNSRLVKLERRKWVNTVASGFGGMIGGVVAVLGKSMVK
jgi:hypothetical protein